MQRSAPEKESREPLQTNGSVPAGDRVGRLSGDFGSRRHRQPTLGDFGARPSVSTRGLKIVASQELFVGSLWLSGDVCRQLSERSPSGQAGSPPETVDVACRESRMRCTAGRERFWRVRSARPFAIPNRWSFRTTASAFSRGRDSNHRQARSSPARS